MSKKNVLKKGNNYRYKTDSSAWSSKSSTKPTVSTVGLDGSTSQVWRIKKRITKYSSGVVKTQKFKYNADGTPKSITTVESDTPSGSIVFIREVFHDATHAYVASMKTGATLTTPGYNGKSNSDSTPVTGGTYADFSATLVDSTN